MLSVYGQTEKRYSPFNLDFEEIENSFPVNWDGIIPEGTWDCIVSLDSTNAKSGKYSLFIESTGIIVNYNTVTSVLPDNYDGEKITLSGYIKTENVTEGYAGLWMLINSSNEIITHSNMSENGIIGTTDWKKYEITLDMNPINTRQIVIGGLLNGNGKMWLDNLNVRIDGKGIQQLKPYVLKSFPADEDKTFDAGSNIAFPELNKQNINDLELLGRIWGFLKYHHPAIAKGNYNWDYELLHILPKYLEANNHIQRDKLLLH
jgi:hypothetical protein